MLKLKNNLGKIQVKSLGIVLTEKSSQEDIERAIKHQPVLEKFFDNVKTEKDGNKKGK